MAAWHMTWQVFVSNGQCLSGYATVELIGDPVISFSSPTNVSCELTVEGIEEVRESRNDSYYTKHKH
jgi:hypothetical protein